MLLVTFLFFLSLVITLTINNYPLYYWEIEHLHLTKEIGLTKQQIWTNYTALMGYLNFPWQTKLVLPDLPVSAQGAFHFVEVKRLFQLNYIVMLVSCVPTIKFLRDLKKGSQLWRLLMPLRIVLTSIVMLLFLMITSFDRFFIQFHHLFFNNQAWLFDPFDDPVILMLPETYFMHCFAFGFIAFFSILLYGIYRSKKSLK